VTKIIGGLGGPMFDPAEDEFRVSSFGKEGGHYNIFKFRNPDVALKMLREWFPDGQCNAMNLVFFSTSGVHGSYTTIEECEDSIKKLGPGEVDYDALPEDHDYEPRYVTVLLVQPRIVSMTYGNVKCETLEDVAFMKQLRESSWEASQRIGKSDSK
jgi:hypothetical protein